jgi:transposase
MISETSLERVCLARGATDLRKSIDGLAVLVKEGFQLDPFSPCLFVFCNRKRDKLKILYWDITGSGFTTGDWREANFNGRKMTVQM